MEIAFAQKTNHRRHGDCALSGNRTIGITEIALAQNQVTGIMEIAPCPKTKSQASWKSRLAQKPSHRHHGNRALPKNQTIGIMEIAPCPKTKP
jgi:hypothetical protein